MGCSHHLARRTPQNGQPARAPVQAKLRIGAVNDPLEREADSIADAVMRGEAPAAVSPAAAAAPQRACAACESEEQGESPVQRKCSSCESAAPDGGSADTAARAVASGGMPLPRELRTYFEPRFRRDLSGVRLHTHGAAAAAARSIQARAFTVADQIGFGAGEFQPGHAAGRRLIAHELAHVAQQGRSPPMVRRQAIEIVAPDFVGPLGPDQRRAAASCGISCGGTSVGTFHAMPMMFTAAGAAPPLAASAGADGISISMHFIRNTNVLGARNPCANCSRYDVIQTIDTSAPAAGRGGNRYVDNWAGATPFYPGQADSGAHRVDPRFPGTGDDVDTTRSIYDHPYRSAPAAGNLHWTAEACVTCERPGRDIVLGCITYGFRRDWDAATSTHGPVQIVGPACRATASRRFARTLRRDVSTRLYSFRRARR